MHIPLYDSQTTPASAYCEKCRQEVYHGVALPGLLPSRGQQGPE